MAKETTREEILTQEEKFYKDYYGQLTGFKIMGFRMTPDEFGMEPFPTFILQHPETKEKIKIEVSRDEEGNGGGFLFIGEA